MRGKIRLLLPAVALILVVAGLLSDDRSGYICGLGILLFALILLSSAYGRRLGTGEIVLIASMAAISCVGRVAFYWLPQFKPVTAIVIISGIMLGAGAGGVVGALSAFLSNFFFGQGVWTPYQMLSWAFLFFAGCLWREICVYRGGKPEFVCIFVIASAFVKDF
ncbi:hypothetical protein FACS1894191_7640 [Clostridia bacterium]|nr:hypothetical protein FACS1894191_7640 [Clostridia bacterium]